LFYLVRGAEAMARAVVPEVLANLARSLDTHGGLSMLRVAECFWRRGRRKIKKQRKFSRSS
jgi:hypothetical protein